jgi:hypothetical protein
VRACVVLPVWSDSVHVLSRRANHLELTLFFFLVSKRNVISSCGLVEDGKAYSVDWGWLVCLGVSDSGGADREPTA